MLSNIPWIRIHNSITCTPSVTAPTTSISARWLRTKNKSRRPAKKPAQKPRVRHRFIGDCFYTERQIWPLRNLTGEKERDERTVCLVVGKCVKCIEVETRLHELKHMCFASNLYKEDLKQLFDFYEKGPKEDFDDAKPIELTSYSHIKIDRKEMRIKKPTKIDDEGKPFQRHITVTHEDLKASMLPHKDEIYRMIRQCTLHVRERALARIAKLRDDSFAITHNLMNLSKEFDEDQKTWNYHFGPWSAAKNLQERFKISNRDVQNYIDRLEKYRLKKL